MDARHGPAVALHASSQVVRLALRLHEDQCLVLLLVRQVFQNLLQSEDENQYNEFNLPYSLYCYF